MSRDGDWTPERELLVDGWVSARRGSDLSVVGWWHSTFGAVLTGKALPAGATKGCPFPMPIWSPADRRRRPRRPAARIIVMCVVSFRLHKLD